MGDISMDNSHTEWASTLKSMARKTKRKMGKSSSTEPVLGPRRRRKRLNVKINSDGSMHIRHMADSDKCVAVLPGMTTPAPFSMADGVIKKQVWNKLAVHGVFKGHPTGPFEMNAQTFAQIEKNFRRDGVDVPFDYEHAAEIPVSDSASKAKGEAVASGWIKDVQNRADGLYGLVEWTDDARKKILSGEMKYISPAIRFGAKDGKTGEVVGAKLSSAALTLRPFLKELPPALASDSEYSAYLCSEVSKPEIVSMEQSSGYALSADEYLPKFRSILKLDDTADADSMLDKIDRLEELCELADGNPNAVVEGVNLSTYLLPIREFMRMPVNTTMSELLNAAAEMIEDSQGVEMSDMSSESTQETTTQPAPVITPKEETQVMETITLSEHNLKLSAAVAEAVAAAVKNAASPLELQIKDLEAKVIKASEETAAERAKAAELEGKLKAQSDAAAAARVEEAYSSYKETKKLSDDDKEAMSITLATKPELFEKLYPKLTTSQSVLLQRVTMSDTSKNNVGKQKIVPDLAAVIADVRAKNPTLDYDKQFDMALKEHATLMAAV